MITRVSFPGADGVYRVGILTGYVAVQGDVLGAATARIAALVADDDTRAVVPVDLDRIRVLRVDYQALLEKRDIRAAAQRAGVSG